ETPATVWRDNVLQQSRSWLKQGLGDRSITRDLTWGIDVPIPGFEGKKLYVWFDAPLGYITNTRVLARERGLPDDWKRWWCDPESRYVAFIGKDNIVFHTLIFPATLLAYNESKRGDCYVLPDNVPADEFLNLEGRKFSKSKRWGIDLRDYLANHSPDPLRYTIVANLPESKDADFTWREYQARVNNELADILGNFVNRTMQFAGRYFDNVVPPLTATGEKEAEVKTLLAEDLRRSCDSAQSDEAILTELAPKYLKYFSRTDLVMLLELARAPKRVGDLYRAFHFREAALESMNVARAANKYFNDSEPWKTRRDRPERCATAINICLQVVRSLAVIFQPIIPFSSKAMLAMLGLDAASAAEWGSASELQIPSGHTLGEPAILFTKFDDEMVEREVAGLIAASAPEAGETKPEEPPIQVELKPEVTIEDVMKLDLRVATVVAAERVKKSDKLLKLQVRIGDLERQIIAGIGRKYEPESLIGRRIVVVANLKPAKLMGQDSQGMLFAANSPENAPTLISILDDDADVRDGFIVR
ncbi:MAG: methionine--tRNA ligase subunit beta, partial [Candidatus Kapaibacterium sp.]